MAGGFERAPFALESRRAAATPRAATRFRRPGRAAGTGVTPMELNCALRLGQTGDRSCYNARAVPTNSTRAMRILHILDHSLPLQSGYVYRTLGIVNQQRALGWEPVLLTSGKHYAPGPARERIGEWEFCGPRCRRGSPPGCPGLRELKIVSDLGRRLDEVIARGAAANPARPLAGAQRIAGDSRRPAAAACRSSTRCARLWEDAAASHGTHGEAGLRYRATRLARDPRAAPRRCGDDDLRGACAARRDRPRHPGEKRSR